MEFQELIRQRFSVREFDPQPLAQEQIESILEAGRVAPTACNNQPQRIWVVTKDEDLAKIDQVSPCRFGAPLVLVIGYDTKVAAVHAFDDYRDHWSFGEHDASIVTTHMMLAAADQGLGSLWVGCFKESAAHELLDIPADVAVAALLMVGVPAEGVVPNPRHTMILDAAETITWL